MRLDKKDEELGYLNSLRHFCEDFPFGEVTVSERPDFVIRGAAGCVGIEITKLFLNPGGAPRSPQSIEAAQDRIIALAQGFAQQMGIPPVTVYLSFHPTLPLHRGQEAIIARAVAQAVKDELPAPDESAHLECAHGSVQPSEVGEILVYRNGDHHKWMSLEYSRVQRSAGTYIERAIQDKAKHIKIYRQQCQTCWLLIVAESFRASGNIKPDERSLSHVYQSPFDRTYFFDNGLGELTRLNTVMPAESANA